jgi:hypothetical protein
MVEAWPAATARTMALECKIDVFLGATAESDVEALKAAGWAVTHSGGGLHYCYFGFNCREVQPPWDHMWYDYHGRLPGFNLYPLNVSSFRLALSYVIGCERTAWCWDIMKYIVVRNDFPMPPGFGEWRNPYIMEYPEDWPYAEDILIENGFTVDKAGTEDRTHWIWYMPNGQVLVGGKNSAHPGSDRLASPADGTMGIYVMSPGLAAADVEMTRRHVKKWNAFFIGEELEGVYIDQPYALFHHDKMATANIINIVWYNRNHDIFFLCNSFDARNPDYLYNIFHSSQDIEGGDNDPGIVSEGLDKMLYSVEFFQMKDYELLAYNLGDYEEVYIPASTHYTVAQPEDIIDVKIERCHKTGVYYEYLVPYVDYTLVGSTLTILRDITLYPGDALEINYNTGTYYRLITDMNFFRDVVWLADWKIFYLVPQMGVYSRDYFDIFKPGHERWVEMPGYGAGAYNLPWTFCSIHETGIPIGGSMKWQNEGDVVTLNPIKARSVYEAEILNRIIEGLITRHPYTGEEIPWIALTTTETAWTAPGGVPGQIIRFTIRDNVTWQDGTPVTATSIKWNFDYIAHVCPDVGEPMPEYLSIWSVYDHSTVVSPYVVDIYINTTGHWKTLDYADVALTFPEVIWNDPGLQNYAAATAFKPWAVSYEDHVGSPPPNGLEGLSCLMGTGPFFLNLWEGGWDESGLAVLSKYQGYWKRFVNPADLDLDMDIDEDDRLYFEEAMSAYYQWGFADVFCDFDGDCDIDEYDLWLLIDYALPFIRNLAVSSVEPHRSIVGQGSAQSSGITSVNVTSIDVKIDNEGYPRETFNVTLYADSIIINQTEVSLDPYTSQTITLQWNFTGFAKGNYTIKAYIEPKIGEWSTEDNTCTSWVIVTWLGDVTSEAHPGIPDGIVGEDDPWYFNEFGFINYYKLHVKNANCDFDEDCDIDEDDLWASRAGFIDYSKAQIGP